MPKLRLIGLTLLALSATAVSHAEETRYVSDELNQRTAEMQQKVAQSDSVINGLKEENQKLKNELIVAQKKVDAASVQLDDKQRTIIMQWFMYGGGVLGLGLLLGLVLPHLIPSRKRKDRWMN